MLNFQKVREMIPPLSPFNSTYDFAEKNSLFRVTQEFYLQLMLDASLILTAELGLITPNYYVAGRIFVSPC